jgi:hypothetical protein
VATLLEAENPAPAAKAGSIAAQAAAGVDRYSTTGDAIAAQMPGLVKGAGFSQIGSNKPLTDPSDITFRAAQAATDLRVATRQGYDDKTSVVKSMNPGFLNQFGPFRTALSAPSIQEQLNQLFNMLPGGSEALKSFTLGNLGIGTVYGLVPFDLLAPSRLIYPVYTVYRNKLPRPPGQGASRMERVFTGISGSQTGGQSVLDVAIPELVSSTGTFTSWPLNLPAAGSQTEVTLNVPYRFFGVSENLSWLSQFGGQGFEDISALANLIMLQEMMLGEEYQMICGSSVSLTTPSAPTGTARVAGSNEVGLSTGSTANFYVSVTATNLFGETVASTQLHMTTVAAGNVVDITIPSVTGAMNYNIYDGTTTTVHRAATGVGGIKYTLQGPIPSTGTVPPLADTGTGKGTRMEGIIPVLTGQSVNTGIYPANWQGGYVNNAVGTHLSYSAVNNALKALWYSTSNNPGAFKADPAELVSSGSDIANLSSDIIAQGSATNYRLFIQQTDVGGVQAGAAVDEFRNPITRSIMKMVVHPWYTQGNADLLTYQLPQTWTNVANAWEMTVVQDYVSIAWPVIDATFRYSLFLYGSMMAHAPQYSAHLGGLQNSDTTPYS